MCTARAVDSFCMLYRLCRSTVSGRRVLTGVQTSVLYGPRVWAMQPPLDKQVVATTNRSRRTDQGTGAVHAESRRPPAPFFSNASRRAAPAPARSTSSTPPPGMFPEYHCVTPPDQSKLLEVKWLKRWWPFVNNNSTQVGTFGKTAKRILIPELLKPLYLPGSSSASGPRPDAAVLPPVLPYGSETQLQV